MSASKYPVQYTDGENIRLAYSPADEVGLKFDGFVVADPEPAQLNPFHSQSNARRGS